MERKSSSDDVFVDKSCLPLLLQDVQNAGTTKSVTNARLYIHQTFQTVFKALRMRTIKKKSCLRRSSNENENSFQVSGYQNIRISCLPLQQNFSFFSLLCIFITELFTSSFHVWWNDVENFSLIWFLYICVFYLVFRTKSTKK